MTILRSLPVLATAASLSAGASLPTRSTTRSVSVSGAVPSAPGVPLEGFVSYSIEFSSFPDFAGNISVPNTFSNNLLNNLGNLTGEQQ